MTTNIDTIKLTGRPGTEPVVRQLNNNKMMARFAFASSEETTDEAGKTVQTTRWHQVVAWGKCAALVQQKVRKGKKISIVGKHACRRYTDKNGQMREKPEIVLYNLYVFEPQIA